MKINLEDRIISVQTHIEKNDKKVYKPFCINFKQVDVLIQNIGGQENEDFFFPIKRKIKMEHLNIPYIDKFENRRDFMKSLYNIEIFKIKGRYDILPEEKESNVYFHLNTKKIQCIIVNEARQKTLDKYSLNSDGIPSEFIALDFTFQSNIVYTLEVYKEDWNKWYANYLR